MAFLTGYTKRAPITVSAAQVGAGGVTDFPMLVPMVLPDDVIAALSYTDGRDIRFCNDAADTVYSHELVSIDTVAKTLQAWVLVPSILSSADTTIYLNCGNADATMPSAAEQQATWGNDFVCVWHSTPSDATPNGLNGAAVGSISYGTDGPFGADVVFDGSGYITIPAGVVAALDAKIVTVSVWLEPTAWPSYAAVVECGAGNWDVYWTINNSTGGWNGVASGVGVGVTYSPGWTQDAWQYGVFRCDATTLSTLQNGTQNSSATGGSAVGAGFADRAGRWGGNISGSSNFVGRMAELRFASVHRTAPWITTEYNNQYAPGTFASFGPVESAGGIVVPRKFNGGFNAGFNRRVN